MQTEPHNIHKYIQTESDINLFVNTIADLWSRKHTKETDDYWSRLPRQSRQLLWLIAAWMSENVLPSERTLENMAKLLTACFPETKRHVDTPFEVIVGNCKNKSIQDKYAYFKHETFGIHSNFYRETIQLCTEALRELSFEELVKSIQKDGALDDKTPTGPREKESPLFGEFAKRSGQDLQVNLYEKYLTAIHEASHAVAYFLLKLPFYGVTIVSVSDSGGKVYSKNADQYEPCKRAIAMYAGGAGELAILNPVFPRVWNNGADVRYATEIIKQEVIQELSNPRDALQYVFIDADALGLVDKESPYIVYETIKRCVAARQEAIDLITTHKDMVAALADELLKKQSMPSEDVIQFLDNWQAQHNHQ